MKAHEPDNQAGKASGAQAGAAAQQGGQTPSQAGGSPQAGARSYETHRAPSRGPSWLLFVMLLLALGGLGWFGWQQQLALQSSLASGETQVAALRSQYEALTRSNRDLQESLQQQAGELASQAADQSLRLQEFQQQLLSLRLQRNSDTPTPAGILLAEAQSLLRLGRERLLAAQDVPVALGLYLAADQVLQRIDDPAVQQVRQTLLRETDSLRGVRLPDLGTLHARLGDLRDAVADWPLAGGGQARGLRLLPRGETGAEAESDWLGGLKERLSRYVIVSRQTTPVSPLLGEDGQTLVRLQMALQLEQARLALLRGEPRLYQQSLDALAASIESWVMAPESAALLENIGALRNSPLQASLPPVGATLDALQGMGAL